MERRKDFNMIKRQKLGLGSSTSINFSSNNLNEKDESRNFRQRERGTIKVRDSEIFEEFALTKSRLDYTK